MVGEQQSVPPPPPVRPMMPLYPAQYQQPQTSWWKYLLAFVVGLLIGTGGYFAATTLLSGSLTQQATPATSSSPQKTQATKSQNPRFSLKEDFCSKPSGICFNYPEGFKVAEDETPSAKENV